MRLLPIILLIWLSLYNISVNAQCSNANFETGTFTGWSGTTGDCCPINLQNNGIVNGQHTIMSGTGTDPRTCNNVAVVAPGGTFSARLGNNNVGAEAEGLSYTFFVTPQSTLITYQYAVVFEDPGHLIEEQPRFESRVLLQNGDTIPCTEFSVTAASDIPGFQTCPGVDNQGNAIQISYKNWTTVGVDVSAYIGQNVTLQFQGGDCSLGGHYGYAYIDAKCGPLEIDVQYCVGSDSAIVAAPDGFAQYLWSTGDTTQQITVDPNSISNLTCLIISFSGCQAVLSANLSPTVTNPSFTYTGSCVGQVDFTNTSTVVNGNIVSYIWTFGDNTNTSNQINPQHTYIAPGTYVVSLTVISDEGCASSTTQIVTIYPYPNIDFTSTYECLGDTVYFTDMTATPITGYSISSWSWEFGDGNTSNLQNPYHLYNSAGTYFAELKISIDNSPCIDSVTHIIQIKDKPVAEFTTQPVCEETTMSFVNLSTNTQWSLNNNYFWNFNYGGATSLLSEPSITYPFSGNYNVSLVVTNSNGLYICRDTVVYPVEVYPKPDLVFTTQDICEDDTVDFVNSSTIPSGQIINYVWDFGDGNISNIEDPSHVYTQSGVYNVDLIGVSDHFCRDTVTKQVNVYQRETISFTPDITSGCIPLTINFTDNTSGNIIAWFWDFGDGSTSTNQNTSHTYTDVGIFDVSLRVTTDRGCQSNQSIAGLIQTYPVPRANFTFIPQSITDTSSLVSFINTSTGASIYYWSFGNGSTSTEESPQYQYPDTGTYRASLIVENNYGCTDTLSLDLLVKATFGFFVPNAFTPDGNNKNEIWFPVFRNVKEYKCLVFNRWGEEIFIGDINNPSWDGTYKGTLVQNDVYVYRFIVKDIYDETHVFVGRITIIK